jgi:WD40 repeat protein
VLAAFGVGRPASARFSPDERHVATSGDGFEIWDVATQASIRRVPKPGTYWELGWHPDGQRIAIAGTGGRAEIHPAFRDGEPIVLRGHGDKTVYRIEWSPDGTRLVTAGGDRTARLWSADGTPGAVLPHPEPVLQATWDRAGRRIATACWDQTLRIWDATTATLIAELRDDLLKNLDVAWSPDGRTLAAASHAGVITTWDVATRARKLALPAHTGPAPGVAWSPDGAFLASAGDDQTVRIWDVATGRLLATRTNGGALSVMWDRAGTRLLSASYPTVITEVRRDRHPVGELVEIVKRRVPWRLVDGRLEAALGYSTSFK